MKGYLRLDAPAFEEWLRSTRDGSDDGEREYKAALAEARAWERGFQEGAKACATWVEEQEDSALAAEALSQPPLPTKAPARSVSGGLHGIGSSDPQRDGCGTGGVDGHDEEDERRAEAAAMRRVLAKTCPGAAQLAEDSAGIVATPDRVPSFVREMFCQEAEEPWPLSTLSTPGRGAMMMVGAAKHTHTDMISIT